MDPPHERTYAINRRLLSCVGIWPFQDKNSSHLIVFGILLVAGSQLCCKVKVLTSSWSDMDIVIECMPPLIIDLTCAIKLFNWLVNKHKCDDEGLNTRLIKALITTTTRELRLLQMKSLIEQMLRSWKSRMTQHELEILRSYAEDGRKFTILWIYYIYSIVVTFLGLPLLPQILGAFTPMNVTGPRQLPTPVEYYHVDTQEYYYPILLHASVTAGIFCTVLIASDAMFVVFVQHACGLFALLAHRVENILQDGDTDVDVYLNKQDDLQYISFFDWIDRHNRAIEFAELIESSHATSFMIIMGLNMVVISFSGVQILSDAATPHLLVRQSSLIAGQMFHLYVDNFYSQKLMDHSSSLHRTIWSSHWYRTSIRTRKLLRLMKMRALVPCVLTAGGLYVMSMENFGWVLKTSMSYFTMLRSLQ